MKRITRGNWAHRVLEVDGPTVIEDGNLVGADFRNPGQHDVILRGGNLRGLKVDGQPLTGPADHPPWLQVDGAYVHYQLPQIEELSEEARMFLDHLRDELGEGGVRLWRALVEAVHARRTATTLTETLAALSARIEAAGAPFDAARFVGAVKRLADRSTWADLRAAVLAHRPETWREG